MDANLTDISDATQIVSKDLPETVAIHDQPGKQSSALGEAERVLVLEPGRTEKVYWADIWHYRELFAILAWRDIAVRYKQTVIGIAWAIVRPLLTMIIFTIVFEHIARLPTEGSIPYPVLVFVGMLPWFMFSAILTDASNSLVSNANLIGKIYFPRLIVPSATVVVALADLAVNLVLLLALMAWFGLLPDWRILLLPAFVVMGILASLGPALLLSALNVRFRDFRHIIPFIVQLGLYISPVGFSSSVVPASWRLLYSLNPMVSVIDGFRWCVFGGQINLYLPGLILSSMIVVGFLCLGISVFRKTERVFADLI